ncbi:MAG: cytidylate kinase-like family protein [Tidjanibacter sp.]|nr:cytidylate kinase-like family protein [Tidjanibacter sp.]
MEKKRIIVNVGRQFASGGKDIAVRIGELLDVKVYDRELITESAKESGVCSEFFERADEKTLWSKFFGFTSVRNGMAHYGNAEYANFLNQDELFKIQSDVIRQIAARESAIFVGRCADYILRDDERALNIFISADREARIERICTQLGLSERKAVALMEQHDKERATYYNYYTFKKWGAAESYDLCINSTRLGIESTADFLASYVGDMMARKTFNRK